MTRVPNGPDPNFPNRPDHPHFRLLADLSQQLDGDLDEPVASIESFCADEKIDLSSVEYLALNKAEFANGFTGGSVAAYQAMFHNAFVLGYLFAVNRTDLP